MTNYSFTDPNVHSFRPMLTANVMFTGKAGSVSPSVEAVFNDNDISGGKITIANASGGKSAFSGSFTTASGIPIGTYSMVIDRIAFKLVASPYTETAQKFVGQIVVASAGAVTISGDIYPGYAVGVTDDPLTKVNATLTNGTIHSIDCLSTTYSIKLNTTNPAITAGTLVGMVTCLKKYQKYNNSLSDGTDTAVGILLTNIPELASGQI
ncbi:MAG: head decoration protein, partial [Ignavibacteria bacterium]|nr:head decoration protein [Ignavibacteria bacterium]